MEKLLKTIGWITIQNEIKIIQIWMWKWHVSNETQYSGGFWVGWLRIWDRGRGGGLDTDSYLKWKYLKRGF